MTNAKKTQKPTIAPSGTSKLFSGRKPGDRAISVTSERIATDLDAFHKAGGHIEVLGNTRSLKKIGEEAQEAQPVAEGTAQSKES